MSSLFSKLDPQRSSWEELSPGMKYPGQSNTTPHCTCCTVDEYDAGGGKCRISGQDSKHDFCAVSDLSVFGVAIVLDDTAEYDYEEDHCYTDYETGGICKTHCRQ